MDRRDFLGLKSLPRHLSFFTSVSLGFVFYTRGLVGCVPDNPIDLVSMGLHPSRSKAYRQLLAMTLSSLHGRNECRLVELCRWLSNEVLANSSRHP